MKTLWLLALGAGILTISGCVRKVDVNSSLSNLTNSFSSITSTDGPATEAAEYVSVALTAVRQNDYAGSVVALQAVRRMPNMSVDQLRSVQETIQALTSDLVTRAANGDAQAQAALAAIEKTRSQ
jgi:hypothetical protein